MKSNALLKFMVPIVILIVAVIVVNPFGRKKTEHDIADPDLALTADEAKALGIEGDTPKDTLATIVGQMKAFKAEISDVKNQNDLLQKENKTLRERDSQVENRINQAIQTAKEESKQEAEIVRSEAKGILDQLQQRFDGLKSKPDDLPVGFGLEQGDGQSFSGSGGMVWVEPSDAREIDPRKPSSSGFAFPNAFNSSSIPGLSTLDKGQKELRATYKGEHDLDSADGRNAGKKPFYTIAENSTLIGSTAMTALIGRIPVDGTVNDPYPFKILIGPENLAANGIDLPEVTGAVMSGTATGDWTLSCVRGQVESITFVFADGTIRTVPEPEKIVRRGGSSNTSSTDMQRIRGGIGYLSDEHGIPCLAGERRSNAQSYLGTQSLVTAIGAAAASALSKEDGGSNTVGSGSTMISGSSDRNGALNAILTGGVEDIRGWVDKLHGQAFAAIYVPPHRTVAVHIEHELAIDYEPNGRKVNFNADIKEISHLD